MNQKKQKVNKLQEKKMKKDLHLQFNKVQSLQQYQVAAKMFLQAAIKMQLFLQRENYL